MSSIDSLSSQPSAAATAARTRTPRRPTHEPTAPPVERRPMRAVPWFGLVRGVLVALMPGLRAGCALPAAPWSAAARRRRAVLLAGVLAFAATAAALQAASMPAEAGPAWWLQAVLSVTLIAWLGAGAMTALMGAFVMLAGDRHALPDAALAQAHATPIDPAARTAVIMPICNEDVASVFAALEATCESTAATGALALFDFHVLSDTADPARRREEYEAWRRLRERLGDAGDGDPARAGAGARVFIRWRNRRRQKKAGNVADFCRRHGARYRYMVVLDADSTMAGDTLVALVRLMEARPTAGIVQTLPQGAGATTLHARAQQFAQAVSGRLFALGMAYWQLGDSHYWGHNAILRVEPFMRHCALAPLPGKGGLSGEILSHDFVEAALMGRAGFEVWLAPSLAGSWEQYPPHLLDELQRDRRWCQGNLQNARLVAEPGWRPAHRAMFAVGALSYAVAPLWLVFVAAGIVAGVGPAVPSLGTAGPGVTAAVEPMLLLAVLTLALLLLPRVLGVAAVLLARRERAFGGRLRLVAGALLELLLSAVLAPVRLMAHAGFVLGALSGFKLEWRSPLRQAERVRWREAVLRIGALVTPALTLLAGLVALMLVAAGVPLPSALPVAGQGLAQLAALLDEGAARGALLIAPLLLAVPSVWAGTHPWLARAARRLGFFVVPDEQRPPRPLHSAAGKLLAHARRHRAIEAAFAAAIAPARSAVPAAVRRQPLRSAAWGLATAALAGIVVATPRLGQTPEVPEQVLAEAELIARVHALVAQLPPLRADEPVVRRVVRERPARMIDNEVRRRALEHVRRALEAGEDAMEPAELSRAADRWGGGVPV